MKTTVISLKYITCENILIREVISISYIIIVDNAFVVEEWKIEPEIYNT